ncbi:MAG: hypothetical protein ACRYGR_02355 [Janthinobacterium lividum]
MFSLSTAENAAIGLATAVAESGAPDVVAKVQGAVSHSVNTFVSHNPELQAGVSGLLETIEEYAEKLGSGVFAFVEALIPHIGAVPSKTVTTPPAA